LWALSVVLAKCHPTGACNFDVAPRVFGKFVKTWVNFLLCRHSDSLRTGRSGDWIPMGARFSATFQIGPGAQPASYTMGTGSFPGGNAAGAWLWPPTPSSAEVKQRV